MIRKFTLGMALAVGALASTCAIAQDTVKIGVVLPLTGGLAPVGKQVQAGIQLYIQQHGATVVGKTIDPIIKDDAGVPDNTKRLAQELIVNDKVGVIGSGHTPGAMAVGPLSTQSKTANVVMVSGTSGVINPNNPYMVRTSFTLGQQSGIIGEWAAKNGSKKVVIVQSDWAPGAEATAVFSEAFSRARGEVVDTIEVHLQIPISRRSSNAPAISTRTRYSCSCRPGRPEPSPSSSPNAGSTRQASSSSDRATSSTTTIYRGWGIPCSAW